MNHECLLIITYILILYKYHTHNRIVSPDKVSSLIIPYLTIAFLMPLIWYRNTHHLVETIIFLCFVSWITLYFLKIYHHWLIA